MDNVKDTSNRTVNRALEILQIVADNNNDGLILSDISRMLGIPKSSISSILTSLKEGRLLNYNEKEKRYYLGGELFNLGNRYVDDSNILSSIGKVMEEAAERTGYTSFFAVLSGNEVRYLLRKVSSSLTTLPAAPQYALKASCTGVGKALLIDSTRDQLDVLFSSGIPKVTSHTITDTAELYSQLVEMRESDIAYEQEESSVGIQCKATPIRFHGKIIAAVSISFPIWINKKDEVEKIISSLRYERSQIERIVEQNPNRWVFSSLR